MCVVGRSTPPSRIVSGRGRHGCVDDVSDLCARGVTEQNEARHDESHDDGVVAARMRKAVTFWSLPSHNTVTLVPYTCRDTMCAAPVDLPLLAGGGSREGNQRPSSKNLSLAQCVEGTWDY